MRRITMDNWINTYQRLDIYKYVKIALPAIVGGLSVGEYHHNLFTYLSSTYIKQEDETTRLSAICSSSNRNVFITHETFLTIYGVVYKPCAGGYKQPILSCSLFTKSRDQRQKSISVKDNQMSFKALATRISHI